MDADRPTRETKYHIKPTPFQIYCYSWSTGMEIDVKGFQTHFSLQNEWVWMAKLGKIANGIS